jgi:hypothetical protein
MGDPVAASQSARVHEAMRKESERARDEGRENAVALRRFRDGTEAKAAANVNSLGFAALMQRLGSCQFRDRAMLARLKQVLASGEESPDDFFLASSDGSNALASLVGVLSTSGNSSTGEDCAVTQLLAAQIVANLTPLQEKNGLQMARSAGPYLVTLLSSGSARLQEASCIALGNLALSGAKVVKVLVNQEVVESLIVTVDSPDNSVRAAGYYALYHLLHTCAGDAVQRVSLDRLVETCKRQMSSKGTPIELPWVLFVLSCNQALHGSLNSRSVIAKALDICTYEIFQKSDSRPLVKIVTPVVRFLSNLCAGPTSESACLHVLSHPDLQAILMALLATNYSHLCKETLWWFGNVVNSDSVLVQEELVELDIMDRLEFHTVQAVQKMDPFLNNTM